MPNTTKQALEESLKHMLLKKPLDKITIRDITEDCGISRMAFYYHFKDIYDLVEWACIEDASKALQGKKTYETWQEGLLQIFEAVQENRPFILNAYRCISREQMERFLYQLTYGLIRGAGFRPGLLRRFFAAAPLLCQNYRRARSGHGRRCGQFAKFLIHVKVPPF